MDLKLYQQVYHLLYKAYLQQVQFYSQHLYFHDGLTFYHQVSIFS